MCVIRLLQFHIHLLLYHAFNVDYLYRRLISDCPHVLAHTRQLNTRMTKKKIDDQSSRCVFDLGNCSIPLLFIGQHKEKTEKERRRDSIERKKNSICKLITVISFFGLYFIFIGTHACLDHDWTLLHARVEIQSIVVSLSGKETRFFFHIFSRYQIYRKTMHREKDEILIVTFDLAQVSMVSIVKFTSRN
jgi:hypothetical protein